MTKMNYEIDNGIAVVKMDDGEFQALLGVLFDHDDGLAFDVLQVVQDSFQGDLI